VFSPDVLRRLNREAMERLQVFLRTKCCNDSDRNDPCEGPLVFEIAHDELGEPGWPVARCWKHFHASIVGKDYYRCKGCLRLLAEPRCFSCAVKAGDRSKVV